MCAVFVLLKILCKLSFKILFGGEADPLFQNISVPVQQVHFGLVAEAEGLLKIKKTFFNTHARVAH